jgi:hypothetical protein
MKEVQSEAGIDIYTVCVKVKRDLLWSRIMDRLEREPHRLKYNEHKREWMESVSNFYDNFKWDLYVDNNEQTIDSLLENFINQLKEKWPQLDSLIPTDRDTSQMSTPLRLKCVSRTSISASKLSPSVSSDGAMGEDRETLDSPIIVTKSTKQQKIATKNCPRGGSPDLTEQSVVVGLHENSNHGNIIPVCGGSTSSKKPKPKCVEKLRVISPLPFHVDVSS